MLAAYILMQVSTSDTMKPVRKVRAIDGVKLAHELLGPTDCIAFIEGSDLKAIGETIAAIRAVEGVERTDTRLAFG